MNCKSSFSSVQSLSRVRLCDPMNHSTPEFFTYPLLLWICLLSSICVANVFSQFKLFFSFSFKDQNVFISMKSDLLIFFSFTVCVFCVPSKKFWLGFSQGFRDCLLHFLLWLNFCQSSSHKVALLFYFVLRYSRLINNVVIVSGEQQRDSAIHINVSILPKLHSHGCPITLSRVPYATQ